MAKISILMSTFNEGENYIRESVESILNQSFCDFELIVINDNPARKDISNILQSYNDPRIIYLSNDKNIGLAMSMNQAAKYATSSIYARMDADDIAESDRLQVQFDLLTSGKYDLVFSNYTLIDDNSEPICDNKKTKNDQEGLSLSKSIALNPSIVHHPTVMMTKEIFERVNGYRNFPCSQDADLWLRLQEVGCRFYRTGKSLLRYRVNSHSISRKKWFMQRLTWYYIFDLSVERLRHNGCDSYSLENYKKMLDTRGVENPKSELKLQKSYKYLQRAQGCKGIARLFYRVLAFTSHPILRQYYKNVRYKRKKYVNMAKSFIPRGTRHPRAIFQWFCRDIRLRNQRKKLQNYNFSVLSNTCLGSMVVHDYNQPHLSPTVNLFIKPTDYLNFLNNLDRCLEAEVIEEQSEKPYPVGSVDGNKIYFMHYHSFSEAKAIWYKRAKRVNKENLLVILVERDGCTYEQIKAFDELPYKNKVAVVHRPYPDIKSAVVMPGCEDSGEVGRITDWNSIFGRREYDEIDWVSILNNLK